MEEGRDGFQVVRFRLERIDEQPPLEPQNANIPDPEYSSTIVSRRIRDSQLSRQIKQLYDFQCQVCETQILAVNGHFYAEGAHVRPLGRPHVGQDNWANILCMCPNHHTQFDLGGMVVTDRMEVVETRKMTAIAELTFRKSHFLDITNVRYHRQLWISEEPGDRAARKLKRA